MRQSRRAAKKRTPPYRINGWHGIRYKTLPPPRSACVRRRNGCVAGMFRCGVSASEHLLDSGNPYKEHLI